MLLKEINAHKSCQTTRDSCKGSPLCHSQMPASSNATAMPAPCDLCDCPLFCIPDRLNAREDLWECNALYRGYRSAVVLRLGPPLSRSTMGSCCVSTPRRYQLQNLTMYGQFVAQLAFCGSQHAQPCWIRQGSLNCPLGTSCSSLHVCSSQ